MKNEDRYNGLRANFILTEQSPSTSHTNLLIGAITNYVWDDIAPFFNSYVQAGFEDCECVMFVANMSEQTLDKLRACGVTIFPIPEKFRNVSIINCRWKIYADYLNAHEDQYSLVFTADVRDVIFQQDIFKYYDNSRSFLGVGYEDSSLEADTNKKWLIDAYGRDLFETIKNERIICVGTIWGTPDKFVEFSEVMWEKLSSEWAEKLNVIEQAVGNWLIYHEKMFSDALVTSGNPDGKVITIGLTRPADIRVDSDGTIRNTNGEIAAVVHMYDRHRKTARAVFSKYGREIPFAKKFKVIHSYDKAVLVMKLIRRKGIFRSASLLIRRKIAKLLGKELPMK